MDMGSTTTDLIPIRDGQKQAAAPDFFAIIANAHLGKGLGNSSCPVQRLGLPAQSQAGIGH